MTLEQWFSTFLTPSPPTAHNSIQRLCYFLQLLVIYMTKIKDLKYILTITTQINTP